MDKRYQIFVSSTFRDLMEERQSVLKAVLELNHMPAGMELFPAADETAWLLIKEVIDNSDYYVLIIGGCYGSLDEEGIGYTEKEYDYAHECDLPIIALLHEDPESLPRDKTDTDYAAWTKLKDFRTKVEKNHTCVYWKTAEDLKSKVIIGITSATKRYPRIGWIRANRAQTEETLKESLALRKQVEDLQSQLDEQRIQPPKESEDLVCGDGLVSVTCSFVSRVFDKLTGDVEEQHLSFEFKVSWNEVWGGTALALLKSISNKLYQSVLQDYLTRIAASKLRKKEKFVNADLCHFMIGNEVLDTFVIQFRALGLMKESDSIHAPDATYWTITPYGDQQLTQLRAIRKIPPLQIDALVLKPDQDSDSVV